MNTDAWHGRVARS